MARLIELTPNKTYATPVNAQKAVEKLIAPDKLLELTYFIHREESTGRYFPVFIGERAMHAGIHFHFNLVA